MEHTQRPLIPSPAHQEMAKTLESATYAHENHHTITELTELACLRREVENRIDAAVREMRKAGEPWYQIGHALGITAQGAQQRYGRSA